MQKGNPKKKSPKTNRVPKKKTKSKKPAKRAASPEKGDDAPSVAELPDLKLVESMLAELVENEDWDEALDEAQEMMYQAWEAPTRAKGIRLARKALKVSENCADAYSFLAETVAKSRAETIDYLEKAVVAGARAIGEKEFEELEGEFWSFFETRPYMRARSSLAQALWWAGRDDEAIAHFWELLRLNPNDNQGIRYLLVLYLIENEDNAAAEKLLEKYEDDASAGWVYPAALLAYRKEGDSPGARKSLSAALGYNPHVPPYLLGTKKFPNELPDYVGIGDDNEAVAYSIEAGAGWKRTRGALEWLAFAHESIDSD